MTTTTSYTVNLTDHEAGARDLCIVRSTINDAARTEQLGRACGYRDVVIERTERGPSVVQLEAMKRTVNTIVEFRGRRFAVVHHEPITDTICICALDGVLSGSSVGCLNPNAVEVSSDQGLRFDGRNRAKLAKHYRQDFEIYARIARRS